LRDDILNRISVRGDCLPALINEIRQESIPLVLLGTGALGAHFYDLFTQQGIHVEDVAVHRRYWKEGMELFGRKVLPLEDVLANNSEMNVFCALQFLKHTKEMADRLLSAGKVKNVFAYDTGCIHWGYHSLGYDFLVSHKDRFSLLYDQLEDQLSRDTLVAYLNQRISGRPGYLEQVCNVDKLFPSDIIHPTSDETVVDCGAFDGTSILAFVEAMRMLGLELSAPMYALEPDATNRERLKKNCGAVHDFRVIPLGAWDAKTTLHFSDGSGATSRILEEGGITIEVDRIDSIFADILVSYIRMDIEGAEMNALIGAENTIRRLQPKLGIAVYHRPDDLVRIPQYLRTLNHGYKLYLRAHSYGANDVFLYAL
jgi:FkbM family methyltransferase